MCRGGHTRGEDSYKRANTPVAHMESFRLLAPLATVSLLVQPARFRGEPGVEILLRLNRVKADHSVMHEAAQLRADHVPLACLHRGEPHWLCDAGDGILLHPHLWQREAVHDVLARQVHDCGSID